MRLSIIIFCLFLLMSNFVCGNETIKETFDNMINDHINGEKINIIYGDVENYHDFFSSVVLSGNLAKYIDENYTSFPLIISEDEYDNQKNIILIGGPCANKVSESIINNYGYNCKDWQFTNGEQLFKVVQNGDGVAIIIAGNVFNDTNQAIKKLKKYESYPEFSLNDEHIFNIKEGFDYGERCTGIRCFFTDVS